MKRSDTFLHPVNLRDSIVIKRLRKDHGEKGALFGYFMFEEFRKANKQGYKIPYSESSIIALSTHFDLPVEEIYALIETAITKGLYQVDESEGKHLRCKFFEEELLPGRKRKEDTPLPMFPEEEKHELQKWVKEKLKVVSKLPQQLTYAECVELLKKYTNKEIADMLLKMENYKPLLQRSNSVYLTLINWFELKAKKEKENQPAGIQNNNEDINLNEYRNKKK